MNTAIPVIPPSGTPPAVGNYYVLFWSLLNILILVATVAFVFWFIRYLIRKNEYKKQLIDKLDTIILLLQSKSSDDN
jgi:hypothetical protein